MHWLNVQTVGRCAAVIVAAGFLFAPAFAAADEAPAFQEPVVPPGQEELLSAMLGRGAALPDGCKFAGGDADGPIIRATYTCPTGEVVFEVVHPSNAAEAATQTERFAIAVQSGSPPTELADTLASLIHSREADFEWVWLTADGVEDEQSSPPL
jgi:hypothetical protein